jgi:hypothetical protein
MYLASAFSNHTDVVSAVNSLMAQLDGKVKPSYLVCYYTENYNVSSLINELKRAFPGIPFHGCSSCLGVMTDQGYHSSPAVALLAIQDTDSSAYGTSYQPFKPAIQLTDADVVESTNLAINLAIESADRKGELPSLILLHASVGNEELIIETIKSKFGFHIPLIGGSAADNGNFTSSSFLTDKGSATEGVSVSVFYPSSSISTYFSSGYLPAEMNGIATKVKGRVLYTIDHQPALEVYRRWIYEFSGKEVDHYLFNKTMAYPLGRVVGYLYDKPFYKLSHLLKSTDDGGVEVFSDIKQGERLYLMQGSSELLVKRASRVVEAAKNENLVSAPLEGGINIFCAGSMVLVKDRMDEVCHFLRESYREKPFICPFTFGEQGRFINEENVHGNLMASTALFYAEQ